MQHPPPLVINHFMQLHQRSTRIDIQQFRLLRCREADGNLMGSLRRFDAIFFQQPVQATVQVRILQISIGHGEIVFLQHHGFPVRQADPQRFHGVVTQIERTEQVSARFQAEFLREASHLKGFYVPSLYDVRYGEGGEIVSFEPKYPDVPKVIRKRIIRDFEHSFYPTEPVIPHVEAVHDRVMLEVFRGCIRGCRFCQAGMTCRPIRERSPEKLDEMARSAIRGTGYSEISMCALSISDYTGLSGMCEKLLSWCPAENVRLSLPSMRVDSFSQKIMDEVPGLKKGSFTFAPEAGTQRLRDVIHKGVTEEDVTRTMNYVFSAGMTAVKLYFIDGLPNERDEDVIGIASLAQRIVNLYYQNPDKPKGKGVSVNVSVSCFIPKPLTPFQWAGQNTLAEVERKQKLVRDNITTRKISYSWHDARSSRLEAVMARGDRRLSAAIVRAFEKGQIFDAWDEHFHLDVWEDAISEVGLSSDFYANREIPPEEILPWDHISAGVSKAYLLSEYRKAMNIL